MRLNKQSKWILIQKTKQVLQEQMVHHLHSNITMHIRCNKQTIVAMPSKIVHGQNFVIPNYPIENNNFATMGPFQRIDSKTNNLAIIIEETVGHNRKTLVILKTLDFGVT